jgi:hypothetical protein
MDEFRRHFNAALEQALIDRELERQARWTEAVAAGERTFVEAMEEQIHWRQQMTVQEHGGSWARHHSKKAVDPGSTAAYSSRRRPILPGGCLIPA